MVSDAFYEQIKLHILSKLVDMRCWMGKHTNINNMQKGLPGHARDSNVISKVVKALMQQAWILGKPTHYGLELSLNIKMKKDIEQYIDSKMP
ncbi:MAG TPA: hypothetical protein VJH37_00450 [Candidatus Nanoarchaeia archaeon]|nr:hypothetical protein [Candidatus Nanoarchaeia archaeon]